MPDCDPHVQWAAEREKLRGDEDSDQEFWSLTDRLAATPTSTLAGLEVQLQLLAELERPHVDAPENVQSVLVLTILDSLAAISGRFPEI